MRQQPERAALLRLETAVGLRYDYPRRAADGLDSSQTTASEPSALETIGCATLDTSWDRGFGSDVALLRRSPRQPAGARERYTASAAALVRALHDHHDPPADPLPVVCDAIDQWRRLANAVHGQSPWIESAAVNGQPTQLPSSIGSVDQTGRIDDASCHAEPQWVASGDALLSREERCMRTGGPDAVTRERRGATRVPLEAVTAAHRRLLFAWHVHTGRWEESDHAPEELAFIEASLASFTGHQESGDTRSGTPQDLPPVEAVVDGSDAPRLAMPHRRALYAYTHALPDPTLANTRHPEADDAIEAGAAHLSLILPEHAGPAANSTSTTPDTHEVRAWRVLVRRRLGLPSALLRPTQRGSARMSAAADHQAGPERSRRVQARHRSRPDGPTDAEDSDGFADDAHDDDTTGEDANADADTELSMERWRMTLVEAPRTLRRGIRLEGIEWGREPVNSRDAMSGSKSTGGQSAAGRPFRLSSLSCHLRFESPAQLPPAMRKMVARRLAAWGVAVDVNRAGGPASPFVAAGSLVITYNLTQAGCRADAPHSPRDMCTPSAIEVSGPT